jgi:hypothetical protein
MWVATIFTIFVWTFLYKDNDLYVFAEYTYVGVSVGYGFAVAVKNIIDMGITPIAAGETMLIIPLILGFLLYTNFVPQYRWISRWPMAVLVGLGVGLAMRGAIKSDFIDQIRGTLIPLVSSEGPLQTFNNILIIVVVITILYYFVYTIEPDPSGSLGAFSRNIRTIARALMMVGFGAAYGNVMMYRFTIFLGRVQYILYYLLGL